MDVINEIIRQSAIGSSSKWSKSLVLSLFTTIVLILLAMLVALLLNAPGQTFSYGY